MNITVHTDEYFMYYKYKYILVFCKLFFKIYSYHVKCTSEVGMVY